MIGSVRRKMLEKDKLKAWTDNFAYVLEVSPNTIAT